MVHDVALGAARMDDGAAVRRSHRSKKEKGEINEPGMILVNLNKTFYRSSILY